MDPGSLIVDIGLLLAAFALALPVAWERHRERRPAGVRTFPIVALASCAFLLMGRDAFVGDASAQARVLQGLITGIGFIGGGAILKELSSKGTVMGIATAASIWSTAAIGAAVAFRRFEIAVLLAAVNFLILRYLPQAVEEAEKEIEEAG